MFLYIVVFPLVIFSALHASTLAVQLAAEPYLPGRMFAPLWLFGGILAAVYAALRALRFRGNLPFLSSALAVCGVGVMLQFRIGTLGDITLRTPSQMAFPIGVALMLAAYWALRCGRLSYLEAFWPGFLALAVGVVLFVLIAGRSFRGAVFLRGGVNPVEIVKPLLVLFAAALLSGHRAHLAKGFLGIPLPPLNIVTTIALFWCVPMAALLAQRDMGLFALMNFTLVAMFYAATGRRAYMLFGLAAMMGLAAALIPMSARGAARLTAWRDPASYATGAGWQPLQALVALYTGGVFGAGLGAGSPGAVPIVESDFAYVIVGEELGFVGCLCLALLYVVMVFSASRAAAKSADAYRGTVAAGLAACLGFQTLMNIGGVVKALPLTGIPLPLVSHGGSSLVTTFLMVGVLLAVSDERPRASPYAAARALDAYRAARKQSPPPPRKPRAQRKASHDHAFVL